MPVNPQAIGKTYDIPVTTDVHSAVQIAVVAKSVDMLQIPAFLCRQTDLLMAAGDSGLPVNIKKGQFVNPRDMEHAIKKIERTGNKQILITERGTCFGYNDLVVDMRGLAIMREFGYPVIFDATHSTPNNRKFAPILARAAAAVGVAGIFAEVHDDPDNAPSDGASMVHIRDFESFLRGIKAHDV